VTLSAATNASRKSFGLLPDGRPIEAVELSNSHGMSVRVLTLGATVQSLVVPDRHGQPADVVLGHTSVREYAAQPFYCGATVGRYANRIARGRFALDGSQYSLETNDGANHLHGGRHGFHTAVWTVGSVEPAASSDSGSAARVILALVSPAGAGGYPGELSVTAAFSLNERNELTVEYRARSDAATIVNISNHSYFNLAGETADADILAHRLELAADYFTPVDAGLIPTGELRAVAGGAFDFRTPAAIGARMADERDEQIRIGAGYDHNFVLNGAQRSLRSAAHLHDPSTSRSMELLATAPALQLYTGNHLNGTAVGKSGRAYRRHAGLCLEPQHYPDAPNQPDFPSARLDPGDTYVNIIVYRFYG
jgi:aldose 1-epimerase